MTSVGHEQLLLDLLAEGGKTGFWICRDSAPHFWADAAACRLLRCTNASSLDQWLWALDANERLAVQVEIAQACATRSGFARAVRVQSPAGEIDQLALRGRWSEPSPSGLGELLCVVERTASSPAPRGEINGAATVSVDMAEAAERDARLLAAFDQAPVGIVLVRLPGAQFVYVNAYFERLSGYTKAQTIGANPEILQLWHPPDRGRFFLEMLQRDGHVHNRTTAYRRKDGTIGRALISADRVELHGETLSLCTIHDQSELEEARSKLALSEARYQLLAEASFEGVALVRNGLVVEVNRKMASILGVPQNELVDGSASRHLANVLPITPPAIGPGYAALQKIDYVRPEGHMVCLEMSCRALAHGGGGTYIITLRDITEKIQKDRTLKNLQASMAHLMDSGMVGMMAVDVKGSILDANDYILHLLQRSRAELEAGALNWIEMTPPEYLASAERLRMHEQVLTTGCSPAFERPMLRPDGTVVYLLIAVVLQPDSIERALVIALDMTESKSSQAQLLELNAQLEKRTVQAERAEAVKALFLSSISHELRTPMHTILGYVRLLRKKAQAEEDEQLAIVERRGTHLLRLIDDLLEFNHTAVAPDNLRMEFMDMDGFVRSLESMFCAMAEQTGNQFHLQLPKVLPLGIVQDEGRLVQVLRILMDNACKYTTEGHITLSLDSQQWADAEGRCRLSFAVQDSGRGIVDADAMYIFEPMRRGQNADDRPGLGLGLAIAAQWIQRMGSRIEVQSQVGVGSCFRFELLLEATFEVVPRWREPQTLLPALREVREIAEGPTLPEDELVMFGQLINMGRMGRLGTWARELAANHPELQAVADQVASLAAMAEVDALERLYQRSRAQHAGH
jgi:PAS domain S-box-containing protein